MKVHKLVFNPFQENCYLVWDDTKSCVIIDPGCRTAQEQGQLASYIEAGALKPQAVLLTHAHLDHIFGVKECAARYNIPVYMDPREESSISGFNPTLEALGLPGAEAFGYEGVKEGDVVKAGNMEFRALSTPGHSEGGLCWWNEKEGVIFSGDTLFAGSIGRTDNNWGDLDTLTSSIKNTLMALDGTVDVYPGHGPATSIGKERLSNPFITEEFGPEGYEE